MRIGREGPGIGPAMGVLLVATTMIGSGVFLLPATLATVGTISVLGWLLAASGALLIGLTLARLALAAPGSFLDAIGTCLGPFVGQFAALLYFLAYPLVLAAVAIAAGGNIGFLVPEFAQQPAAAWLGMALVLLLVGLTHFGAVHVARFGSLALLLGLVPILLVALGGWAFFDPALFRAGWNSSGGSASSALFQATLLCFWAFLGLETASVVSRQMRDPERSVPIATVGGIALATIVYLAATTAISGMLAAPVLARSTAPFADATALMLGPISATLVALAAATKALGTLGATQLGATETWLGVQRLLGLGRLSFRNTNLLIGLAACLTVWLTASPTLAAQYGQIISAVVILTLLVFALAGMALARARTGPERLLGLAAVGFCLGLLGTQPAQPLMIAGGVVLLVGLPLLALGATRRARNAPV